MHSAMFSGKFKTPLFIFSIVTQKGLLRQLSAPVLNIFNVIMQLSKIMTLKSRNENETVTIYMGQKNATGHHSML